MGHLKPAVARGAIALVGLVHHNDARVLGGKRLHDGQGGVLAAIVDADDLKLPVRLRQDALQALRKVLLHIADGDYDGHEGGGAAGHKGPLLIALCPQW